MMTTRRLLIAHKAHKRKRTPSSFSNHRGYIPREIAHSNNIVNQFISSHINNKASNTSITTLDLPTTSFTQNNFHSFFSTQSNSHFDENNSNSETFNCEAVLENLAKQLSQSNEAPFKNVMVVAIQHILGTTVDMFKVFKKLGLERAIIGGKSYSTHKGSVPELTKLGYTFIEAPDQLGYGSYDGCMRETVTNIWNAAFKSMEEKPADLLIVLDDGGDLILSTPGKLFNGISYKPKRVIGIEQTRGGSNHRCFKGVPYPIINVAGSYVKTAIEYPWVAEIVSAKVLEKIQQQVEARFNQKPIIGVVGNGTMGKAIVQQFRDGNYRVLVHDKNQSKTNEKAANWRPTILTLISDADIIIGCTGTDITADVYTLTTILNSIKQKYFVSTSSKDVEFNSLLTHIQEQTKQLEKTPNPFTDIEYINSKEPDSRKITILRGGFPINFDNKKHSVPSEKIWVTRAALLSACLMAVHAYNNQQLNTTNVLKLDSYAQKLIIQTYENMNPYSLTLEKAKKLLPLQNSTEHISQHSDGVELNVFRDKNEIYDNQTGAPTPMKNRM